jgi:hypothetical protein
VLYKMSDIIQFRRGTAAGATASNPTLAEGEPGYETDTGKLKIGNATSAWADLSYFNADEAWTVSSLAGGETGSPTGATNELIGCVCTDGNIVVNLPLSATALYKKIVVGRFDGSANTLTVNAYSGETIFADASVEILYQWTTVTFFSFGDGWIML